MNDDVQIALLILVVGVLILGGAVYDFASGRTSYRTRRNWSFQVVIDGEDKPIEFLIRVMITLILGTAIFSYGAYKLIGGWD